MPAPIEHPGWTDHMLRKKQRRNLTDEQRQRILSDPGTIVHRRKEPANTPVFAPKVRVDLPIRASELIDAEHDDEPWYEER